MIIKQQEAKERVGAILLPHRIESPRGEIIATGPEVKTLKIGDTVLFNINHHMKFFNNGKEYITLNEGDILAVMEPEDDTMMELQDSVGIQTVGTLNG